MSAARIDRWYRDKDAIPTLLKNEATPEAFRRFYAAERSKISAPLFWRQKLHPEHPASCAYQDNFFVIFLDRVPPTPADAVTVAHELAHAVLFCEGFKPPSAVKANTAHTGAATLGSMLQDPLITRRLRAYELIEPQMLEKLDTPHPQPSDVRNQLLLAWWFETFWLCHIEATDQPLPSDIVARFRQRCPTVWKHVEYIERTIERVGGYDTPARHTAIFRRVIAHYKLDKEIKSE